MNIYQLLNEMTQYIEDHLEEEIKYDDLAKILGVNVYTMQRIFSLLTQVTLAEYIRKRRLSNAGVDLYQEHLKVMDVAVRYQYDSATSFSRAFEAFHGIKPSAVCKFSSLKNFPRIVFDENVKVTNTIEYHIVHLDEMKLYGVGISTNNEKISYDAPHFFAEVQAKYEKIYGGIKYGMITYDDEERKVCDGYYVLYDQKIDSFEEFIIPASRWLKFYIPSQDSKEVQELSHRFYLEFLPSCKYNFREIPELEYYHDGITEFYVPIY